MLSTQPDPTPSSVTHYISYLSTYDLYVRNVFDAGSIHYEGK
jgi:hypothetical protein